jgi:8-oxo-dGTP pyrophosphatase MutT (NUDIX family)
MDDTIPVKARPAASLLLLRERASVLMGMRGAGHSFMPNRLVFPGGAVDAADRTAAVARPLPQHALAALVEEEDSGLAHGIGVAAAREDGLFVPRDNAGDAAPAIRCAVPGGRCRRGDG